MNINRRGSLRLKGYDYAQAGAYFVTICTHDRACLLGEAVGKGVRLSDAGRMIQAVWDELSNQYPGVETDVFAIMPNHIHGIVVLVSSNPCVGVASVPTLIMAKHQNELGHHGFAPTDGCSGRKEVRATLDGSTPCLRPG